MAIRVLMVPDPRNTARCSVSAYPADHYGGEFPRTTRHFTSVDLLRSFVSIQREELGRDFLKALLRGQRHEVSISDAESADLFRSF
jgi:hypothetical protein